MSRYINESYALERLKTYIKDTGYGERANLKASYISVEDAIDIIEDAPTEDVVPVVHAHRGINVGMRSYCSNCGHLTYCENYCTFCGAKMDGKKGNC